MLRLEHLFDRLGQLIAREAAVDHHYALATLFEIMDVGSRADLKSDLLKELERHKSQFNGYRGNPSISEEALDTVIQRIDTAFDNLNDLAGKAGISLTSNEWLMSIRSRISIPGGTCEFDLPAYHYWLHQEPETRQRDLASWIEPFDPIRTASAIVLRLLRENARTSRHIAYRGAFQLMLTTTKVAQLLRLTMQRDLPCVPEISANKYALNIRFIGASGMDRGNVVDQDIEFEMMFCNL